MAIEIRELVIKAVIVDDDSTSSPAEDDVEKPTDKQALIQECVNQVLKILKRSKNR